MTPQEEARRKAEEYTSKQILGRRYERMDAFIAGYTADKWIDCKVRSPMTLINVLIVRDGKIVFGYYDSLIECWCIGAREYNVGVTHWQPLPQPPKTNEG